MQFKTYDEVNRMTINQLAAMYSDAEPNSIVDYKILFLKLIDAIEHIEVAENDNKEKMKEIFKPMLDAPKLAPPPSFIRRYEDYVKDK